MNLKDALKKKLTKKQLESLKTSFDIVGDIAIIEIPEELGKKEKEIAKALVSIHPHLRAVCRKLSERRGEFRLRGMKLILGKSARTRHREYGCSMELDVRKAYYSPREATERQGVASQAKPGETILVMFAGIGAYALVLGKKPVKVYAIEINPDAYEYMVDNVRINKLGDRIIPVLGDVKLKSRKYYGKCDRVIMPLPKEGYRYLPQAIKSLKPGGVVHFYHVEHEGDMFREGVKMLEKACEKEKKKCTILAKRKVLLYGPRTWKVCIEAKIK